MRKKDKCKAGGTHSMRMVKTWVSPRTERGDKRRAQEYKCRYCGYTTDSKPISKHSKEHKQASIYQRMLRWMRTRKGNYYG